jgi:hypothetical protein
VWIADWSAMPATGVDAPDAPLPGAPADGAIALSAQPSVTRDATEIRASLPLPADASVALFDASGRLVRTLAAPRGATSVRWDGCDDRGVPARSGHFFARLEGRREARPARILLVR